MAPRPGAPSATGRSGGPAGGRIIPRAAGATRAPHDNRGSAGTAARGAARGTGHENLGRAHVSPDRRCTGYPGKHGCVPISLRVRPAARGACRGADFMRDEHDPLEEELHSMQPCELSADVRRRIEEELAATVLPTQSLSHKG